MNNFREVNEDILKEWLMFREDDLASLKCDEDRKHFVYFDEISANILRNVPKENKKYVQKQLNREKLKILKNPTYTWLFNLFTIPKSC